MLNQYINFTEPFKIHNPLKKLLKILLIVDLAKQGFNFNLPVCMSLIYYPPYNIDCSLKKNDRKKTDRQNITPHS